MKRKVNKSHFIYETRKVIEKRLNSNALISEISKEILRHKSSIAREIERHTIFVFPSTFNNSHPYIKNNTCPVKSFNCYEICKNIEINLCPKLISSPHVCNNCNKKKGCRYVKKYYKASEANCEYLNS